MLSMPKNLKRKFNMESLDRENGWRHSNKKPLDLKVKNTSLLYKNEMPSMYMKSGAMTSASK